MTDRKARTDALLASDETIDNICAHVGSGGTLVEWTRLRDLSYVVFNEWIEADPARRDRYSKSVSKRDDHNRELIIGALREFMDFDPLTALNDDGTIRALSDIPIGTRRCVTMIEVEELFAGKGENRTKVGELKKIKFTDRNRAAETLARSLKMLTDKKEHDVSEGLAELLTKS